MPSLSSISLIDTIRHAGPHRQHFVADGSQNVLLSDLAQRVSIESSSLVRGRCVLVATTGQLPTLLALMALDGSARRIVIATPDLSPPQIDTAIRHAGVDVIATDGSRLTPGVGAGLPVIPCSTHLQHDVAEGRTPIHTEWVLFTSGSTGHPKLVQHTLATLMGPLGDAVLSGAKPPVWSTFYDIRRYGGLQVLLRALAAGDSMILSDPSEPPAGFLRRLGDAKVTHVSGTPSHWRRALMSGAAQAIAPNYVRLSGEAADQGILDALMVHYPGAQVAHAFASTEAGVAFDVRDGKAGFPASRLSDGGPVQLRIHDGSLQIRSSRVAACYIGPNAAPLATPDGFVDTGDIVELHGDRYVFIGRRHDIINVGGLKIHPEVVESVINCHPAVSMSRVSSRRSPITGSIAVADIVLRPGDTNLEAVQDDLMAFCRQSLSRHEVPVSFRIVPSLEIAASGKLLRHYA